MTTTRIQQKEAELISQVIHQVISNKDFLKVLKECIEDALETKIEPLRVQLENLDKKKW